MSALNQNFNMPFLRNEISKIPGVVILVIAGYKMNSSK